MWQCHGFPVPAPPVLNHRRSGSRPVRDSPNPVRAHKRCFSRGVGGTPFAGQHFGRFPREGSAQTTRFPRCERGFCRPGGEIERFPSYFRAQVLQSGRDLCILTHESAVDAQGHRDAANDVPLCNRRDATAGLSRKRRPCFRANQPNKLPHPLTEESRRRPRNRTPAFLFRLEGWRGNAQHCHDGMILGSNIRAFARLRLGVQVQVVAPNSPSHDQPLPSR